MVKAILFDLDHTIIDWDHAEPWEDYQRERLRAVLAAVTGAPIAPDAELVEALYLAFSEALIAEWQRARDTLQAPSLMRALVSALATVGLQVETHTEERLAEIYDWQARAGERAYPDASEVLPVLAAQGLKLGVVTNASQPMAFRDRELRAFGLLELFDGCRISAADVGVIKPHRAIFEHALACLNLKPEEVVFVGDSLEADIYGAQGAGMRAVWRENDREMLPEDLEITPDGTIATFHDLLPLLDTWYPGWRSNGHRA